MTDRDAEIARLGEELARERAARIQAERERDEAIALRRWDRVMKDLEWAGVQLQVPFGLIGDIRGCVDLDASLDESGNLSFDAACWLVRDLQKRDRRFRPYLPSVQTPRQLIPKTSNN